MNKQKQITKKGLESKNRILENAIELIISKGYENITIKDICESAETGTGTFYHYFDSKQDIIVEYIKLESQDFIKYFNSLKEVSFYDKLIRCFEFQFNFYLIKTKDIVSQLFFFELNKNSRIHYEYPIYNIIYECVNSGQNNGEFTRNHSCEFLSKTIYDQYLGVTYSWVNSEIDDISELIDRMKEFLKIILF